MQYLTYYIDENGLYEGSESDDNLSFDFGLTDWQVTLLGFRVALVEAGYVKNDPFYSDEPMPPN